MNVAKMVVAILALAGHPQLLVDLVSTAWDIAGHQRVGSCEGSAERTGATGG